jgi:hypothetical protein
MHEGYKSPQPLFFQRWAIEAPPSTKGVGGIFFFVRALEKSLYENHTNKFIHQLLFNPAC